MKDFLICIISDNNIEFIKKAIPEIQNVDDVDLLIVDDGSEYDIIEEISDYKFAKCIIHEAPLGYGTSIDSAFCFAKDMGYKYLITLDPSTQGMIKDVPLIMNNLKYGYDMVTCSRMLENFNLDKNNRELIEVYEVIAAELNSVTGLDITDPLSSNKGYNMESLKEIELTDSGHGALLQLFVQSVYFAGTIIEVPSEAELPLGVELYEYDNPLEEFHAIIETEKYLYNKGTIN
ncbi:MAG TPA: glycosyltransferase [Spirochaetota bacterium]|nr:glycosyltransferase [Spirochaetota bacterium]